MTQSEITEIFRELKVFRGGAADTSTLIYLDKCGLLAEASSFFQLLVPAQVVQEFGRSLPECLLCPVTSAGDADSTVLTLALERGVPLLSEDRQLLQRCRRQGTSYYNTLMILLSLLVQGGVDLYFYRDSYARLRKTARYAPAVWQVGDDLFSLFVR